MTRHPQRLALQTLVKCGLFALILGVTAAGFLAAFAPPPPPVRIAIDAGGAIGSDMDKAMEPDAVALHLKAILACGSRFQGQPGLRRTQTLVRDAFVRAGLALYELPQATLTPLTLRRTISSRDGTPLPDVAIYPFQPNHFQPIATPSGGLTGVLVRVDDELLKTRPRFDDAIAVIDVEQPPALFGLAWIRYAALGFKAVILAHPQGLEAIHWETLPGMRASVPVNYPRLAANAAIFSHLGETVILHVQSVWHQDRDATLVGILSGERPTAEAVVITACTDAPSILPDLAPGTLGAVNLAAQLAALDGLDAIRRDPRRARDIVFVSYSSRSMALMAADALLVAIGPADGRAAAAQRLRARRKEHAGRLEQVRRCAKAFHDDRFLVSASFTAVQAETFGRETRRLFEEEARYVLNELAVGRGEARLQARLAFLREGRDDVSTAAFAAYRDAGREYDAILACVGRPLNKLLAEPAAAALVRDIGLRERLAGRLAELVEHHAAEVRATEQALAVHNALSGYARLIAVTPYLAPADAGRTGQEELACYMGAGVEALALRQSPVIHDIMGALLRQDDHGGLRYLPPRGRRQGVWGDALVNGMPMDAALWNARGFPAFALISPGRPSAYALAASPVDEPGLHDLDSLRQSLKLFGRMVWTLGRGAGAFETPLRSQLSSYSGQVFLAGVGKSTIPTHPVRSALVAHKGETGSYEQPGFQRCPFLLTDPRGRYELPMTALPIIPDRRPYSPEAAAFGADGRIHFMKDEGPQGQRVYKSINAGAWRHRENIHMALFRAAPVTLFDTVNPQTLTPFTGFGFLCRDGLAAAPRYNLFAGANGIMTAFLDPDLRFFVTLKAGALENARVQKVRAFLLNADPAGVPDPEREIDGRGYLAADTPYLPEMPREAARSLQFVNGRRLDLQTRHRMADARVAAFHERATTLLDDAAAPDRPALEAGQDQRAAAAYGMLNHPVLRRTIAEAVAGILWFLALLVPCVFFCEKLIFGFSDIRRQLAAQAAIFLAVFALLRALHPAFAMIRSSLMILLGFAIMMIAGGITVLFSGKFKDNLESLRQTRGRLAGCEPDALGVLGTAFALGLNNMRRRPVRTALTAATLVLLTFAMIGFTSIHSDIVDSSAVLGRAPYQGLLIKNERLEPIADSEYAALRELYGNGCVLAARRAIVGVQGADRVNRNPVLEAIYEPAGAAARSRPLASAIELSPDEPLRHRIRLLAGAWFPPETPTAAGGDPPVLIPDTLARAFGLDAGNLERSAWLLKINGRPFRVHGIFDPTTLAALRDLDGRDLLPFDVEAMRSVRRSGPHVLADDTAPRLDAAGIVLVPPGSGLSAGAAECRLVSVAVDMSGMPYRQARERVTRHLERSGRAACYGLRGMAYRGRRAREYSLAGLLDLLIPLAIAAVTVLNTMRGSVYERRDEIFVYNAVGIAPRYVFAMFFSEAFVYGVVGSMLGFILSQLLGRTLTYLDLTGGMNMTFTSIHSVYASWAVMAAVFLSTIFPARAAMRLAVPAEDAGWNLPAPEGDTLAFDLPFAFTARDRMAVLAFFRRYLLDHGEGGGGRFHTDGTALAVSAAPAEPAGLAPECRATVWLKPFDLGVSQRLRIVMTTEAGGEAIARLTLERLSGSRESWLRLNRGFVTLLRRRFLFWRAAGAAEREELFEESRRLFAAALEGGGHG